MIIFVPIKEVSQRVPRKNFRHLNEVPLYKRCLYKLRDHQVFVDTDSSDIIENIQSDPKLQHVTPILRNMNLLGHNVSVCDLIKDFIITKKIKEKNICQLHVTSPFLATKTLEDAGKLMMSGHDSVVACNNYQNRLWRKEAYGFCPVNHNPLKLEQTQDLPVYFEENSLFYIFNTEFFLKTNCRVGSNPYFYVCNYPENVDIDTEDDWNLVKTLCREEK